MSESGFEGDPRINKDVAPKVDADPQNEATVNGTYNDAQKWLRTGLPIDRGYRFVQFGEKDGTNIYLGGYLTEATESQQIAIATDKPLLDVIINPTEESGLPREVYGIVIDDKSGKMVMEKRVDDQDYVTGEERDHAKWQLKQEEKETRIRQDQQIKRGLGEAKMTETQTRAIAGRLAKLTKRNRTSRKGTGLDF